MSNMNISSRSIVSLAILKVNWDVRHSDFIENFVPFFLHLIKVKQYKEIDAEIINKLRSDFKEEYGLAIPYHPIKLILVRLKKKGFLYQKEHKYIVNVTKIVENNFDSVSEEQQRKLANLTHSLVTFGQKQYQYEFTNESAEKALLAFFRENNLGFLSAAKEGNILPEFVENKSARYVVAKFIQNARESDPSTFNFLTEVAVGVALANTIIYGENFSNLYGGIKSLNLYFDTGYIFSLLGIDGKERKQAFIELTESLVGAGAKLFVFEHTYDEVMSILNNALYWMQHGSYDMQKASRTLRYFLSDNFNASDVEMFIAQIPNIFSKYRIQKALKPSYSKDIKYQISETDLRKLIVDTYKLSDLFFDESQKEETIDKDVDSIYSICKLRKGHIAYNLRDASYIFITTNNSLAKISGRVQSDDNVLFSIPPCITDLLIGTLIWLQQPAKTLPFNEKKLIADAYAAIQPDAALIKRYIGEVDSLKSRGEISGDEYYIMRTNRVAFNLLSEKTKNDSHNFEPRTTREIMDELNEEHMTELKGELEKERELRAKKTMESENQKELLTESEKQIKITDDKYHRAVHILTTILTWAVILVIVPFLIGFLAINTFSSYFKNPYLQVCAFVVSIILSFGGFSIFKVKQWLFNKIEKFLMERTS